MSDKHNCDCCGCGGDCNDHDHDHDDFETMTLTLEDGTEVECAIIGIFPVEEKEYIALIPVAEMDSEDAEIFLYGFEELEDGEIELIAIESDEEYETVTKVFDELMEEEYDDEDDYDEDDEEYEGEEE